MVRLSGFTSLKGDVIDVSSTNMKKIGNEVENRIQKRLDSGKDVEGSSFTSYDRLYEKRGPVNLKQTGKLRNSIKVTSKENKINIEVTGERKKIGEYHQTGAGNLPKREWFGMTGRTADYVVDEISKIISKQVDKI